MNRGEAMTETEWMECTDPTPMLEFLHGRANDRKLRLFAVACCRRIWELLEDERSQKAVELAEQSADHHIPQLTLEAVSGEAEDAFEDAIAPDETLTVESREKTGAACSAASYASNTPVVRHFDAVEVMRAAADATSDSAAECVAQAALVRELWERAIRPIILDSAWRTPTATSLAQAAYDERSLPSGELDPSRLAVLSDALEEAGCDDADILGHLRGPGPHVRGCWAVDLLLGNE